MESTSTHNGILITVVLLSVLFIGLLITFVWYMSTDEAKPLNYTISDSNHFTKGYFLMFMLNKRLNNIKVSTDTVMVNDTLRVIEYVVIPKKGWNESILSLSNTVMFQLDSARVKEDINIFNDTL